MVEVGNTGGIKEFFWTKDDDKRIRIEDTESSREFKQALNDWRNNPLRGRIGVRQEIQLKPSLLRKIKFKIHNLYQKIKEKLK